MSTFSESNEVPIPVASVKKSGIMFNALIGEGGFGRVLSGMVIRSRTWYAVKEINKYNVTRHQTGLAMLFSELKALQIVTEEPSNHFIVGLQAAFHDKLSCYLILDLKTGGDLRYYLRKRLIFKEAEVAFFISCIGSALEFIHSKNILHRDVKPENIILDSRGYPHLTDFGVAYVQPEGVEGVLTCNLASGTKQYLAPEVYCKSNAHGIASDYWSLGVLAFELLFGQRPFEKHCPTQHISYLEECLKRTALRKAFTDSVKDGAWLGSPSRDSVSTPSTGPSTPSGCGCLNMTSASTQRTAALETKDALFSSKKRNIRKFPNIATGAGGHVVESEQREKDVGRGIVFGCGGEVMNSAEGKSFSLLHTDTNYSSGRKEVEIENSKITDKSEILISNYDTCCSFTPERNNGNNDNDNNDKNINNNHNNNGCVEEKKNQKEKRPMIQLKMPLNKEEEISKSNGTAVDKQSSSSLFPSQSGSRKPYTDNYSSQNYTPRRDGIIYTDSGSVDDLDSRVEGGFITIDHWTVHATVLPIQLQVLIPKESDWLGPISDSCVEILQGFFDVRPSHRIGGRNIRALKEHSWFFEKELPPWGTLQSREYEPQFQPDVKFMENTFWRAEALEKFGETIREENVMPKPEIDIAYEHSFDGFVHTSNNFLKLIQPKMTDEKNVKNSNNGDINSSTKSNDNHKIRGKNNFILSEDEINIKNNKLNIRISDHKNGCNYTNNSGPMYRKGTYSPKASDPKTLSPLSSSSSSSSTNGERYQSKEDDVTLNQTIYSQYIN